MSIVGPRPCLPNEFVEYSPAQRERFNVVPGLTGLWQVSGKNRTTFEEMVQLDIHYVRHASARLNIRIILLTPKAIFTQLWDTHNRRNLPKQTVPRTLKVSDLALQ
jgi:lipopolysaccharide/colanic/teichoic acid biosynthesis glycosyltransferase